jgi:cytosine/adenosine deaminase-related metal-dependent hydrolase
MKNMSQHLKTIVMSAIADDYEDFEAIYGYVRNQAAESDIEATRELTMQLLGELIRDGFAQAYVLSATPPHTQAVRYSPERINELWFYLSAKGKAEMGHA